MTFADLTRHERNALVAKSRRNTFGKVSEYLIVGLVIKGLVDRDSRRLTEGGIALVEMIERRD